MIETVGRRKLLKTLVFGVLLVLMCVLTSICRAEIKVGASELTDEPAITRSNEDTDTLGNLSDVSAVGPSMAVALVTTFYGSVLANWICTPTATKLKATNDREIQMKEVMVEGLLSIQAGENPRVIEEKLKSFLSPEARASFSSEEGGEENG